jgi:hypothetical protein
MMIVPARQPCSIEALIVRERVDLAELRRRKRSNLRLDKGAPTAVVESARNCVPLRLASCVP